MLEAVASPFSSHLTKTHQFTLKKSRILQKTNKKNILVNCRPSGKYVHLLYMYSILGRGSFCFNYCLNSAWHGGDQFVALLRWCEAQVSLTVAFSSSAFFGLFFLIFLLTISHRFSMFRSGEFAGQSFGHLTNFWCFWQCGQVPNPAGK